MVRTLLVVLGVAALIAIIAGAAFVGLHRGDPEVTISNQGPIETRDFTWTGGDMLTVDLPAGVTYTQGPATSLKITARKGVLDQIEVVNGDIRFKQGYRAYRWGHHDKDITIDLTAPGINRFDLAGAGALELKAYDQPQLIFHLSGAGAIEAAGRTDRLEADFSGAGGGDFSKLAVKDARVSLSGAGGVQLAATGDADISISGLGGVELLTHPAHLTKHISGLGGVSEP